MGSFGRITSNKDLPADKMIIDLVQQAVELNENGVKVQKKRPAPKKELVVPDDLTAALKKNKAAQETFDNFPYSCKKEYVEWITEAKTEPTSATSASQRPSNGSPRANVEIGSTRIASSWVTNNLFLRTVFSQSAYQLPQVV